MQVLQLSDKIDKKLPLKLFQINVKKLIGPLQQTLKLETIMASISGMSLVKKLSLIFNRKAYLIYTNNPIPSLLIPLPTTDPTLKSAIYKTFSDLTNDDFVTFHNRKLAEKDLNNIEREHKAKLNVDTLNLPHEYIIESVQGVEIKPNSMFLTVNQQDSSLTFMEYGDIQSQVMNAKTNSGEVTKDGEKLKKEPTKKAVEKQNRNVKGSGKEKKPADQTQEKEEFKDESAFEKKQMSTWNEEAPQLSTPPEKQPKQDISDLRTNKFIPLAYLSDSIAKKPIEIIHIQTSRQYLLLQFVKAFFLLNVLCVYRLIHDAGRSENHWKIRGEEKRE